MRFSILFHQVETFDAEIRKEKVQRSYFLQFFHGMSSYRFYGSENQIVP